ncbi:MAG: hypothetical protein HKN49_11720 [Gammaproteobacteria bacterium]|nr:hypothetical protein [Gammaproteobacteria bacterium]
MPEDIFKYAESRVANKGVLARIGHSPKLHAARSALTSKGSAASKALSLVGVGARASLNAIPIPALGGILGKLEQAVESKIRSWHHNRRGQATNTADQVKFQLKELSVDGLDRYRKKVEMAVKDLNKTSAAFDRSVTKQQGRHATCDAYLELAKASEQATRRLKKLRMTVMAIQESLNLTLDWANEVEHGRTPGTVPTPNSVNGVKNAARKMILEQMKIEMDLAEKADTTMQAGMKDAFILEYHGKCEQWCCFRASGKSDDWATFKDYSAQVTRFLIEPFSVGDIIGVGMAVDSANKSAAKLAAAQGSP